MRTFAFIPSVLRKEQGLELGMFVLQCTWKLEGEGGKEVLCSLLTAGLWLLDAPQEGREVLLSHVPIDQRQHVKEVGILKTEF